MAAREKKEAVFNRLVATDLPLYDYDFAVSRGVQQCWRREVESYVRRQRVAAWAVSPRDPMGVRMTPKELLMCCLKVDSVTLARWVKRGLPKRIELKHYEQDVWLGYVELQRA